MIKRNSWRIWRREKGSPGILPEQLNLLVLHVADDFDVPHWYVQTADPENWVQKITSSAQIWCMTRPKVGDLMFGFARTIISKSHSQSQPVPKPMAVNQQDKHEHHTLAKFAETKSALEAFNANFRCHFVIADTCGLKLYIVAWMFGICWDFPPVSISQKIEK